MPPRTVCGVFYTPLMHRPTVQGRRDVPILQGSQAAKPVLFLRKDSH